MAHEYDLMAEHDEEFERLVAEEDLILAVTDALTQALDSAHLTQAELAERLGRTPGYVSQIFGGGRNLTLRTVANIARALSMRPTFMLTREDRVGIRDEHTEAIQPRPQGHGCAGDVARGQDDPPTMPPASSEPLSFGHHREDQQTGQPVPDAPRRAVLHPSR